MDNEKWWGVPKAIQAAIWATIPNNKPVNGDPLKELDQSMQIGLQQGVLITQVIAAQIHMGLGHTDQVKAIIRRNKEGQAQAQSVPAYRLE